MNKYCRALVHIPCGIVKISFTKLFHLKTFHASPLSAMSPLTEITLDRGGVLALGKNFRMRDGAKIRVRKGSACRLGKGISLNSNCIIVCRESITIGDGVQFGPGVLIYDHDHDFRAEGGINANEYKTGSIEIGNNVWLGANAVILRGTKIGDNCVVAAGSVVKGEYPANSVIVQKKETTVKPF